MKAPHPAPGAVAGPAAPVAVASAVMAPEAAAPVTVAPEAGVSVAGVSAAAVSAAAVSATAAPEPLARAAAAAGPQVPPGVDATRPSPARLYDYYLGGTNNFEVDRTAAETLRRCLPELGDAAWANRGFHQRAASYLARHGIRQFIDIGSGLPTVGNTHEVVQRVDPANRVVYVDVDPMVAIHSAGLLRDAGNAALVAADLRDPETLLGHPGLRRLIDFAEPAGLLMTAVLHFVADDAKPVRLVRRYLAALAPGSYLVLSHATGDRLPPRTVRAIEEVYAKATLSCHLRPRAEVERFFAGLELVPPYPGAGPELCYLGEWAAEDPAAADSDGSRMGYCGVARCR